MSGFAYLLQVNLYLILFYGFYTLVLRNETFFRLNRIYLVAGVILSFLIPLIQSEWIQSLFITGQIRHTAETFNTIIFQPESTYPPAAIVEASGFTALQIISAVYTTGLIIFLGRFIWQLVRIRYSFKRIRPGRAFSFFNRISIDPLLPASRTILQHERTHARQWHSADVLFFEIVAGINWFNPVVYIYKKAIRHIHEFIADEIAAEQETSKSAYALLLLGNTFGIQHQQLFNNFFNHSLLKRRIFMLSKTKSRRIALLKYGLSAPLFAVMLIFSAAAVKQDKAVFSVSKIEPVLNAFTPISINPGNNDNPAVKTNSADLKILRKVVIVGYASQRNTVASPAAQADSVYSEEGVQVKPTYQGGPRGWGLFMQGYNYPKTARNNWIQGTVNVGFIVEKDGSLSNIKITQDLGYGTGEEALRLMKLSPKWNPGVHNGQIVRVAITQPIKLALN